MAIVIFVPLMAQVAETHTFMWNLFQACFKCYISLLTTIESCYSELLIISMYRCVSLLLEP